MRRYAVGYLSGLSGAWMYAQCHSSGDLILTTFALVCVVRRKLRAGCNECGADNGDTQHGVLVYK
jgi:hypothetical protein